MVIALQCLNISVYVYVYVYESADTLKIKYPPVKQFVIIYVNMEKHWGQTLVLSTGRCVYRKATTH